MLAFVAMLISQLIFAVWQVIQPILEKVGRKRRAMETTLHIVGKPALTLAEKFNFDEAAFDLNAILTYAGESELVLTILILQSCV